jgi:tRNA modification GTPase
LADTAGLRDAEDEIERLGVDRTRSLAEEADVILYVIDGLQGFTPEDRAFFQEHPDRVIGIWNKIDAAPRPENLCAGSPYKILGVSAKTGAGIPELSGAVIPLLTKSSSSASGPGIASERQKVLLEKARGCIREALALADQGQPLDVIAPALREAVNALGEITGEVSAPDILEVMFRKFCVGK